MASILGLIRQKKAKKRKATRSLDHPRVAAGDVVVFNASHAGVGLCRRGCWPRGAIELPHRNRCSDWDRAAAPLRLRRAITKLRTLLGAIPYRLGDEDVAKLHTLATPEMVS